MKLLNQLFTKREHRIVPVVERKPEHHEPETVSYIMVKDGTLKPVDDPVLVEFLEKSHRD